MLEFDEVTICVTGLVSGGREAVGSSLVKRAFEGDGGTEEFLSGSSSRKDVSLPSREALVVGAAGLLAPALPGEMEDAAELAFVCGPVP